MMIRAATRFGWNCGIPGRSFARPTTRLVLPGQHLLGKLGTEVGPGPVIIQVSEAID
jgi:hypothetical protein